MVPHHPSNTKIRKAFTLIELLVVIAIIAILIGLMLPAIQKVREAMRRTECQNNLKQIGIALHAYHDGMGKFPPGFKADRVDPSKGWGWATWILPYIEQDGLFKQLDPHVNSHPGDPGAPTTDPPTHILHTQLNVYRCPSNPALSITNPSRGNQATASYAGVCGNHTSFGESTAGNGVFFRNSNIRIEDIQDGTSNTMMISERARGQVVSGGPNYIGAVWPGVVPGQWGAVMDPLNWLSGGNETFFFGTHTRSNSSFHPGGLHALMVDGSVQFLSKNLPRDIQGYLAQRNDGVHIDLP